MLGKIDAPLNKMLSQVEWGEYKLENLFEIAGTKSLDSNAIEFVDKGINFIGRTFENNGIQGKITRRNFEPNAAFTITATVIGNYKYVKYQKEPYYCSQNINKLTPLKDIFLKWNEKIAYFLVANIQKFVSLYDGQQGGYKLEDIKKHKINLPTKNGKIDFDFMERFVAELEVQRVAELEVQRVAELEAYLTATGLKDYELTAAEQKALDDFEKLQWSTFNLEELFGKSTRGKRLKGDDRIAGDLPFVTAGEADEGISAFISNKVEIFEANTTTIDMFGSAKYRNYRYGADDHVAVVHTEKLSKFSAIFTTSAIHKASHTGKFDYSRNFYAKDADELDISLPVCNDKPDYHAMELVISAIQKLIIKDVVQYSDRKIAATKQCCKKASTSAE